MTIEVNGAILDCKLINIVASIYQCDLVVPCVYDPNNNQNCYLNVPYRPPSRACNPDSPGHCLTGLTLFNVFRVPFIFVEVDTVASTNLFADYYAAGLSYTYKSLSLIWKETTNGTNPPTPGLNSSSGFAIDVVDLCSARILGTIDVSTSGVQVKITAPITSQASHPLSIRINGVISPPVKEVSISQESDAPPEIFMDYRPNSMFAIIDSNDEDRVVFQFTETGIDTNPVTLSRSILVNEVNVTDFCYMILPLGYTTEVSWLCRLSFDIYNETVSELPQNIPVKPLGIRMEIGNTVNLVLGTLLYGITDSYYALVGSADSFSLYSSNTNNNGVVEIILMSDSAPISPRTNRVTIDNLDNPECYITEQTVEYIKCYVSTNSSLYLQSGHVDLNPHLEVSTEIVLDNFTITSYSFGPSLINQFYPSLLIINTPVLGDLTVASIDVFWTLFGCFPGSNLNIFYSNTMVCSYIDLSYDFYQANIVLNYASGLNFPFVVQSQSIFNITLIRDLYAYSYYGVSGLISANFSISGITETSQVVVLCTPDPDGLQPLQLVHNSSVFFYEDTHGNPSVRLYWGTSDDTPFSSVSGVCVVRAYNNRRNIQHSWTLNMQSDIVMLGSSNPAQYCTSASTCQLSVNNLRTSSNLIMTSSPITTEFSWVSAQLNGLDPSQEADAASIIFQNSVTVNGANVESWCMPAIFPDFILTCSLRIMGDSLANGRLQYGLTSGFLAGGQLPSLGGLVTRMVITDLTVSYSGDYGVGMALFTIYGINYAGTITAIYYNDQVCAFIPSMASPTDHPMRSNVSSVYLCEFANYLSLNLFDIDYTFYALSGSGQIFPMVSNIQDFSYPVRLKDLAPVTSAIVLDETLTFATSGYASFCMGVESPYSSSLDPELILLSAYAFEDTGLLRHKRTTSDIFIDFHYSGILGQHTICPYVSAFTKDACCVTLFLDAILQNTTHSPNYNTLIPVNTTLGYGYFGTPPIFSVNGTIADIGYIEVPSYVVWVTDVYPNIFYSPVKETVVFTFTGVGINPDFTLSFVKIIEVGTGLLAGDCDYILTGAQLFSAQFHSKETYYWQTFMCVANITGLHPNKNYTFDVGSPFNNNNTANSTNNQFFIVYNPPNITTTTTTAHPTTTAHSHDSFTSSNATSSQITTSIASSVAGAFVGFVLLMAVVATLSMGVSSPAAAATSAAIPKSQ